MCTFFFTRNVKEIETLLTYKNLFLRSFFVPFVLNEAYQEIFSAECRKKEKGDQHQTMMTCR